MDFHHLLRSITIATASYLLRPFHALLIISGQYPTNCFLSTKLVNLYSRLGDVSSSQLTFQRMTNKSIITWNTLVSTYVHNNRFPDAIRCFQDLVTDVRPDAFTFPDVIKACVQLENGRKIHSWVVKLGLELDLYVSASLVNMYSRFGFLEDAWRVFGEMSFRDLGVWNAMITGFCQNGNGLEALSLFREMMVSGGVGVDAFTLSTVLPVCAQLQEIYVGLLIHALSIKSGINFDVYVSNALVDMYAKSGQVCDARLVFDGMINKDLASWNSMIGAYEQLGKPMKVFDFYEMMKADGFVPDALTLICLASAVAQAGSDLNARSLHGFVLRKSWDTVHLFVNNAIVDMYAKLSNMIYAQCFFDRMTFRGVISWNTLISGYSQNGLANEAIDAFQLMWKQEGLLPNQGTLAGILPACSCIGALKHGMQIHGRAIKTCIDMDLFVGTCVIDMYAKCGRPGDALHLFEHIPRKSLISWNTIIAGHGIHGHGTTALQLFERMQEEGVEPDHVTFLSLLSACSHAGLVDHGKRCFKLMQLKYRIEPSLRHYSCMVDMLGRSGDLNSAYEFIKTMPLRADAGIWGALLAACRIHGNVELGEVASKHLFEVEPGNVGYYVLLSNMYARAEKWKHVDHIRNLAKDQKLKKTPGWSSVEVNNKVHVFFMGNRSHPQCREIYDELGILTAKIKSLGFVPDYSCVLQDVEEDEKENILSGHSERLAMAFGFISTAPRTPIRIFKNLRVCVDCHSATKFISQVTEREITVRDSCRFHHFKDGSCSCGDYW